MHRHFVKTVSFRHNASSVALHTNFIPSLWHVVFAEYGWIIDVL